MPAAAASPKARGHDADAARPALRPQADGAAVQPDTGPLAAGNTRATVAYSLMSTGGNASVEIYINLANNSRLDPLGFRCAA